MTTQKPIWLSAILGVIMIILIGILIFVPVKKAPAPAPQQNLGLQITSPKESDQIFSPLKITGISGSSWGGFEGQIGTVDLLDYKGNNLGTAVLKATSDWTQPPVNFEASLIFTPNNAGAATLVFHNENPSGLPQYDKTFSLSVKIK